MRSYPNPSPKYRSVPSIAAGYPRKWEPSDDVAITFQHIATRDERPDGQVFVEYQYVCVETYSESTLRIGQIQPCGHIRGHEWQRFFELEARFVNHVFQLSEYSLQRRNADMLEIAFPVVGGERAIAV